MLHSYKEIALMGAQSGLSEQTDQSLFLFRSQLSNGYRARYNGIMLAGSWEVTLETHHEAIPIVPSYNSTRFSYVSQPPQTTVVLHQGDFEQCYYFCPVQLKLCATPAGPPLWIYVQNKRLFADEMKKPVPSSSYLTQWEDQSVYSCLPPSQGSWDQKWLVDFAGPLLLPPPVELADQSTPSPQASAPAEKRVFCLQPARRRYTLTD